MSKNDHVAIWLVGIIMILLGGAYLAGNRVTKSLTNSESDKMKIAIEELAVAINDERISSRSTLPSDTLLTTRFINEIFSEQRAHIINGLLLHQFTLKEGDIYVTKRGRSLKLKYHGENEEKMIEMISFTVNEIGVEHIEDTVKAAIK